MMRNIFNWTNLFYFFISSNVWVNFVIPKNLVTALISVMLVIIMSKSNRGIRFNRRELRLLFILSLMSIWGIFSVSFSYGILTFFTFFPAIILYSLSLSDKKETLNFITKWFGIIMTASIVIFILIQFVAIPPFSIFQLTDNTFYPPYKNYFVFIQSTDLLDNILYRFNGPFLEPGHLSVVSSLVLFANAYNFKENKWLWASLGCVLISMSLAGYVITILGLVLLKLRNLKSAIAITVCLFGAYLFVTQLWNGGNNIVYELIVARLEYDEEKGIAGNNRTTERTDDFYEDLVNDGRIWLGIGSIEKDVYIVGAGYKIYFIRFGIISALLVLCFYWNLIPKHYNKRYVYSFIIVLALTFMQRAYPGWFSWLLCFTLGCGCSHNSNRNILQRKPNVRQLSSI